MSISEAFTRQSLSSFKEKKVWMTWHPIMERLLSHSTEMKPVYQGICDRFGYNPEYNSPFLLAHEAIWMSGGLLSKDTISHKRSVQKELSSLHEMIPKLAGQLCEALSRQKELMETEDFSREEPSLTFVDMMSLACKNSEHYNGHYSGWVEKELTKLDGLYDGRYWPEIKQFVSAIGTYESSQPQLVKGNLPESIMHGRSSTLKDFVLGFDSELRKCQQIPADFSFSNSSMATIANIVLELPESQLATSDTVRNVRHRFKNGMYEKALA